MTLGAGSEQHSAHVCICVRAWIKWGLALHRDLRRRERERVGQDLFDKMAAEAESPISGLYFFAPAIRMSPCHV